MIEHARQRLAQLEVRATAPPPAPQMNLFQPTHPALAARAALRPDELMPKQALEALYHLKGLLSE